jgi:heme/copper-type cytochrome/quinol oxidase subunit 4
MVFRSQAQAKQFFIDKILFQAQKDQITLSEAEQYMLGWTETEGGFELNQKIIDEFEKETTRAKYEAKISNLIKHAYDSDIHNDPANGQTYHAAYRILNQGDHYLLVMIKAALGEIRNDRKSDLWLKDKVLLILTGLGLTLVPFFTSVYFHLSMEWNAFMLTCVFFYLIPFGIYSFGMYMTSKKQAHSLTKIIFFQIAIAAVVISAYVYLIVRFGVIDITSHEHDRAGFRFIVSAPLLIVSIILLDFTLKRGIVYDGITGLMERFRSNEQRQR